MEKVTTKTRSDGKGYHSVDFKANVKAHTAPEIVDEIIEDSGEKMYVLANGNTIPAVRYDAIWNPVKGIIKPKFYKGLNPDKSKVA